METDKYRNYYHIVRIQDLGSRGIIIREIQSDNQTCPLKMPSR